MNNERTYQSLNDVLKRTRIYLSRPGNDFTWSKWDNVQEATRELDNLIERLEKNDPPEESVLRILFAPTGSIQEVSANSGWGEEFNVLANEFDKALNKAFE